MLCINLTNNNDMKKIIYVAGPIDADHVYECWKNAEEDQSYFGARYLTQFYQASKDLSFEPYVIAPVRKGKEFEASKHAHIEYWDRNFECNSGIYYHLNQLFLMLRILLKAIKLKAFAVVVTPARPYWFILTLLPLLGIRVIPSIHCVLWPKFGQPSRTHKVLLNLTSSFLKSACLAILVASDDIAEQVSIVTGGKSRPVFKFLPSYPRDLFGIDSTVEQSTSFNVLFAGRIEVDKGIYLLLEIAQRLKGTSQSNIVFDICGRGSALEDLRRAVKESDLEDIFVCHGYCDKPTLKDFYLRSSVVVVPTTTDFIEGFNQVVCEAVLAGKPVITSEVCPSASIVSEASIIVQPDNINAFEQAIINLYEDRELYAQKSIATLSLREQFYDNKNSWYANFRTILLMSNAFQEVA